MKLSEVKSIEFLSTGIVEIDELLGGLGKGRLTEVCGSEGIGKSYLMSMITANATATGKKVFLLDAEQAANRDRMENLGVKLELVDYSSTYELETASNEIMEAVKTHDLVIIDSIATLKPKKIIDGELDEANIGLFSRQMAKFVAKLKPAAYESGCVVVCVNQFRKSPDMFAPRYVPGGTAYMHALDCRLELATTPSKDKILNKDKERIGHWVNVKITKNRLGKPHLTTRFKLMY